MRRTARIAILGLVMVLVGGGCSNSPPTLAPSTATAAPPSAETASPASSVAPSGPNAVVPDSPAAGIVVNVDGSAGQVKGFTLRTNDGTTVEFVIGQLENADEFPADQLAEHQASAAAILVFFRPVNGELVVYRLEDAG